MGKKGDALRAQKKQRVTYQVTREWLEAHDKKVRQDFAEEFRRLARKEVQGYCDQGREKLNRELDKRMEAFHSDDNEENFYNLMSYLLSVCGAVLVEEFGWLPIPKNRAVGNNRLARFCDGVVDKINQISDDDDMDVVIYAKEAYEKYGIKFIRK